MNAAATNPKTSKTSQAKQAPQIPPTSPQQLAGEGLSLARRYRATLSPNKLDAAMDDFANKNSAMLLDLASQIAQLAAANEQLKIDAALGNVAMRFVDRAGDVHPGIDDAETICSEFHNAMAAELDVWRPFFRRAAAG